MFARVVQFPFKPEAIEQGIQALRKRVLPDLLQEPGYRNSILLVERETGAVLIISQYETAEDARRRDEVGFYRRLSMLEGMLAGRPQPSFYEVVGD